MRKIELGLNATKHKGYVALVDDEDYDELMQWKWYALLNPQSKSHYAVRVDRSGPKSKNIYMARQIMNAPCGMDVDHINHMTLDNRKKNLRVCTKQENLRGMKSFRNSSSQFKGVSFHKSIKQWQCHIIIDGNQIYIGCFKNEINAALHYDFFATLAFGKFGCYNFPRKGEQSAVRCDI